MLSTIVKPFNFIISGSSYLLSSMTSRPFMAGMPAGISFELTNYCNLRCPECLSGSGQMKRERGYMDPKLYKHVLGELKPYLFHVNLYFQGEPMMHPLFFSFPEETGQIFTVVSTNGHYLSGENAEQLIKSGINKLIISLDGMDQESYSVYRINGNFQTVLNGIKHLEELRIRNRSSLKVELQFLVNKYNEHQIPAVKEFAKEARISLKLKSMQILSNDSVEKWMPAQENFRRYIKVNGRYVIKSNIRNRCLRLWLNPVITWDGKVIPCCFDKDAEFVMGDLTKDSFRKIWYGGKYNDFRLKLLTSREDIHICRNCTSGLTGVLY